MDIYVLDGLNGVVDIISSFQSCIWVTQYYGQNEFELVVNASEKNVAALKPGAYLVRDEDIHPEQYSNVMVIQDYKLDFDTEKGWLLTLTGKGLKNDLLRRRIIWGQKNDDDITVENSIRKVLQYNCINPSEFGGVRAIPSLVLEAQHHWTEKITMQTRGDNIAEWMEKICTSYNYGWDIEIRKRSGNWVYRFFLYKGVDRTYDQSEVTPVIFSPEFDNLLSSSYQYNMGNFNNAALVGGEGSGTSQRTASVGDTISGLNRYETYIDGSNVSSNGDIITEATYTQMLKQYGQSQLDQTAYTQSFSGDIDSQGLFKINQDYFLGDIVQIENEKGIKATPRIIEIIYATDENGTSVVPTLSKWEVIE